MFRISEEEWNNLMISQIVTSSLAKRKKSALPYAFTEHGAVMLASVLRSPSAVQMSVMVTRAFIAMRQAITKMLSVDLKVEQIHRVPAKLRINKSCGCGKQHVFSNLIDLIKSEHKNIDDTKNIFLSVSEYQEAFKYDEYMSSASSFHFNRCSIRFDIWLYRWAYRQVHHSFNKYYFQFPRNSICHCDYGSNGNKRI